jgi:hypothetical protein
VDEQKADKYIEQTGTWSSTRPDKSFLGFTTKDFRNTDGGQIHKTEGRHIRNTEGGKIHNTEGGQIHYADRVPEVQRGLTNHCRAPLRKIFARRWMQLRLIRLRRSAWAVKTQT